MATAPEIRQRIYDNLYGAFPTESPFVTRLSSAYSANDPTIDVLDGEQWEVNDTVENTETGEQLKVISIATNTLTVVPAWNGTTATNSVGTDDVLFKNPRFTQAQIDNAVTSVLADFEKWGIHVFGTGTITRVDPKVYYELSETDIFNPYGVLKVYTVLSDSEIPAALPFRYQFELGTDTTEYSQGQGIHLGHFGDTSDGDSEITYVYAKKIGAVTDLLARQEELVVVGATVIVMGGTIIRATHDPGARTDRTTPPGQTSRDVRHFQGRFFIETRLESATLQVERQKMLHESPHYSRARRWVS